MIVELVILYQRWPLAEGASERRRTTSGRVAEARGHACGRAGARGHSRVAAQHGNTRAVLGTPKRHHVLADVAADDLTVVRIAVGEDVLDEVVSELVASNYEHVSIRTSKARESRLTVDQGHAGTVGTTFADALQVLVQEVGVTNLQALLNHLGGILIGAVLSCEAKDVVNGTAAIGRGTMLADVLNAPVAELAMSNHIDASEDFVDARTLSQVIIY